MRQLSRGVGIVVRCSAALKAADVNEKRFKFGLYNDLAPLSVGLLVLFFTSYTRKWTAIFSLIASASLNRQTAAACGWAVLTLLYANIGGRYNR